MIATARLPSASESAARCAAAKRDAGIVRRRAMLDALAAARRPMTLPELARAVGCGAKNLTNNHLPRLEQAGAVVWERGIPGPAGRPSAVTLKRGGV